MRALGFSAWVRQTVTRVERSRRRLTAEEILGLAYALETSIGSLMDPSPDDKQVAFPSGQAISVGSVQRSVRHFYDGAVGWFGDAPDFGSGTWPWPAGEAGPETASDVALGAFLDGLSPGTRAQIVEVLRRSPVSGAGAQANEPRPVVVAAIVTSAKGVLITRRRDGEPPWGFVTGEVEPGEQPEDAAIREVKEETGLEVRITGEVIGERDHPQTGRHMTYLAVRPVRGRTNVFVGDRSELAEVRWASLAEAEDLLPGMFEPVREHLARVLAGSGGRP